MTASTSSNGSNAIRRAVSTDDSTYTAAQSGTEDRSYAEDPRPSRPGSVKLPAGALDEIVQRVVERLEQRELDEMGRRGRGFYGGTY